MIVTDVDKAKIIARLKASVDEYANYMSKYPKAPSEVWLDLADNLRGLFTRAGVSPALWIGHKRSSVL